MGERWGEARARGRGRPLPPPGARRPARRARRLAQAGPGRRQAVAPVLLGRLPRRRPARRWQRRPRLLQAEGRADPVRVPAAARLRGHGLPGGRAQLQRLRKDGLPGAAVMRRRGAGGQGAAGRPGPDLL